MNKKLMIGGIGCLCMMALLTGCGKKEKIETTPVVKTETVKLGREAAAESVYAGSVRGRYETNMAFQVGGQILSRQVQAGSRVKAGQVMMTVDPKDVVQKDNAAQANLQLAAANYERYQKLYAADAISAAMLDQYRTAYEQAASQAAQSSNALSYTELIAPADGVVTKVTAEMGQVVGAGTPVLTFVQTDELEIEINIPENKILQMPVGKDVIVSFWALANQKTRGIVREVSPMADPVARTFTVRISLPEPPNGMQLGMTSSVTTKEAESGAKVAILPMSAIYQTGDVPEVWVVNDGKVSRRKVKTEGFNDNKVKVTGLKDGDVVVTAGAHKLLDGQAVRLRSEGGKP